MASNGDVEMDAIPSEPNDQDLPKVSPETAEALTETLTLTTPLEERAEVASALLGGTALEPAVERGFVSYPRRWFVLAVVMILNGSNAFSWIGYAPVANYVDEYYGSEQAANYLSMIFLFAAIPIAFVAMWSVRYFGLRSAILIAGVGNGLGAVIRLLSSMPGLEKEARLYIVLGGQAIAASAYPFIMFLPAKASAAWFPAEQRVLATTLMTLSNPLGVLFANIISPQLVTAVWHVTLLNALTFVPCIVGMAMALLGVCSSEPPTPPSASAAVDSLPFFQGVKRLMRSRNYWLLLLALGGGMGMFNALYTIMQQMLCPKGYSNDFAGLCCVLMIVGGIIGAMASGKIVAMTGAFEETMKVAFSLAVLCGIAMAQFALIDGIAGLIAVNCFLFGLCGLAAYPLGLELAAECTFPVAETTSSGFVVLSGQIQGFAYIALLTALPKPLTKDLHLEVCSSIGDLGEGEANVAKAKDMTLALLVFCAVAALLCTSFTIFFRPKLRRRLMEQKTKAVAAKGDLVPADPSTASGLASVPTKTSQINDPAVNA